MITDEKTLAELLSRYKQRRDTSEREGFVFDVSKDDLAELGAHTLRSALGFLEIVSSHRVDVRSIDSENTATDTSIM